MHRAFFERNHRLHLLALQVGLPSGRRRFARPAKQFLPTSQNRPTRTITLQPWPGAAAGFGASQGPGSDSTASHPSLCRYRCSDCIFRSPWEIEIPDRDRAFTAPIYKFQAGPRAEMSAIMLLPVGVRRLKVGVFTIPGGHLDAHPCASSPSPASLPACPARIRRRQYSFPAGNDRGGWSMHRSARGR